jgi:hypothetical protein
MRVYEEGKLLKEAPVGTFKANGRARLGKGVFGEIDDLRVYDKALSCEEIEKLYLFQRFPEAKE